MIKNYLFDLDGTLLPLDEKQFLDLYISLIGKKFYELGHHPEKTVKRLWVGTEAMVKNDGALSNEDVFWKIFYDNKEDEDAFKEALIGFYQNEFEAVKASTNPSQYSRKIVKLLLEQGHQVFLLTNPIFPEVATRKRIAWAGLDFEDFHFVTTYENSSFAKPNLKYYQFVLDKYHLNPEETMMIGNDVEEDMIAEKLGLKTYLITNCLKNTKGLSTERFDKGTLRDFYQLISKSN